MEIRKPIPGHLLTASAVRTATTDDLEIRLTDESTGLVVAVLSIDDVGRLAGQMVAAAGWAHLGGVHTPA